MNMEAKDGRELMAPYWLDVCSNNSVLLGLLLLLRVWWDNFLSTFYFW